MLPGTTLLPYLAPLLLAAAPPPPPTLQGAAKVIEVVRGGAGASTAKPEGPATTLLADMVTFVGRRDGMAPAHAADTWLGLFERYLRIDRDRAVGAMKERLAHQRLEEMWLLTLPPPAAWPALKAKVAARNKGKGGPVISEAALRVLVNLLARDDAAALAATREVRAAVRGLSAEERKGAEAALDELDEWFKAERSTPDAAKQFERTLAIAGAGRGKAVRVPDLVALAGEASANAALSRLLLRRPPLEVASVAGEATTRLLKQLALRHVAELATPPWRLVSSVGDLALYEALAARFPDNTGDEVGVAERRALERTMGSVGWDGHGGPPGDDARAEATRVALLALVAADRKDDAGKLLARLERSGQLTAKLPQAAVLDLDRLGKLRGLWELLRAHLEREPESDAWPSFIHVSARVGENARLLKLLEAAHRRRDASASGRLRLRGYLIDAALAADEIELAVRLLRAMLGEATATLAPELRRIALEQRRSLVVRMAAVGELVGKPALRDEAVEAMLADQEDDRIANLAAFGQGRGRPESPLAFVIAAGRAAAFEAQLLRALAPALKDAKAMGGPWRAVPTLFALTMLYAELGRHDDVLLLLDEIPFWMGADLADLPYELQLAAGKAFAAKGRRELAARVARRLVLAEGGRDDGYALLTALEGAAALPLLDRLAAQNRFEERPLIWKASLLLAEGRAADAATTARQAIAIDPSDGEQGRGDRLRAYAVLAESLRRQGRTSDATTYERAVGAIRLAERADRLAEAGLQAASVRQYRESLREFTDAYCIQSRLAVRMSDLGDFRAAEEHYRRAYELMPDSFGRIESHCLGCERVFEGPSAQRLAEAVFTRLAEARADKPQVHYLLGMLRLEQGRLADAAAAFRRAVALDPDYLNAWIKLDELAPALPLPEARSGALGLALLRLASFAPGEASLGAAMPATTARELRDFAKAWQIAATKLASTIPLEPDLYPLRATAAARTAKTDAMAAELAEMMEARRQRPPASPAAVLAGTRVMRLLAGFLRPDGLRSFAYGGMGLD